MYKLQAKKKLLSAVIFGMVAMNAGAISAKEDDATLDKSVMDTLDQCKRVSTSCAENAKSGAGILVFPSVIKADLIVGGAGGKGALVENGQITGYYNIGAGSAGLQAGIENNSQVYIFKDANALADLKKGPDWKVGATADVTVVKADTNANANTGHILAYVFDSKGLNAGISLDVFDVWKSGQTRPS